MITNIKQIRIRAAGKMIAELKQGEYVDENHSAAIICTDALFKAPELRKLPHRYLQFIDTEDPNNPGAFTWAQAVVLRDFLVNLPDHITMLYCCCDWGQSRSAGLAAACMTALGQDCEWVFRCSAYSPNILVYATLCEALGCPPSAERLYALKRLHSDADRSDIQARCGVKRILVVGDLTLLHAIPVELFGAPVETREANDTSIPYTEKELVSDRKQMGVLLPGDLLLVIRGIYDLSDGLAPEEVAIKMRKYLLWLRYTNPSAKILLASPPDTLSATKVSQKKLAQLADCYRRLADDLQIPFVNMSDWNRSTNTQSVMEYLAANVKMDSVNHT